MCAYIGQYLRWWRLTPNSKASLLDNHTKKQFAPLLGADMIVYVTRY